MDRLTDGWALHLCFRVAFVTEQISTGKMRLIIPLLIMSMLMVQKSSAQKNCMNCKHCQHCSKCKWCDKEGCSFSSNCKDCYRCKDCLKGAFCEKVCRAKAVSWKEWGKSCKTF